MGLFGKAKRTRLGVDIGASSLKIVELEETRGGFELKTFGSVPLKQSIIRASGDVLETEVANVLTGLYDQIKATSKTVVTSLPGFAVFTAVVDFPEMSEKELDFAIQSEARKYVPAPLEEVVLDSKVLESIDYGGGRTGKRILLIAAPKDYVDKFSHIFSKTALKLTVLEVSSFALVRALVQEAWRNVVIVDIGAASCDVNVISGGSLFLNRSIDRGGQDLTNSIATGLRVDVARAETMKRDVNLALQQAGPEAAMVEALRPILDSLIAEVARVIDAFTKQYARNIDGVVLTGGGSSMNGLAAYFQSYLHIPVEVGNPWTRIQYPPGYEKMLQAIGPSFATAVGLAMREV